MTDIKIHDRLPSGFAYANAQQADWFTQHGHVKGARKVALVRTRDSEDPTATDLAVRLGPPKATLNGLARLSADREKIPVEDRLKWYEAQYNLGWAAGNRGTDSTAWQSGMTNHAWDDGYLDAAAGRPKWHLAHCIDHDECGEG